MRKYHNKRTLPSLRALQVFEAASRHQGFTEAAGELGVTQGAVSRQVQELERWLGLDLFVRSGPNIKLTATGRQLGARIGDAMDILQQAADAARPDPTTRYVTLSMLPSVAAKWLAPRLGQFIQNHPDIDLRVTASRHFVDFDTDEVDAAIRYGEGNWPDVHAEQLAQETVAPVCTRAYADRLTLRAPPDLLGATLLHTDILDDWDAWFTAAGIARGAASRGPALGDDAATIQAALDGQGVALGRSVLVADDLRAGRLVAPFPQQIQATYSYWFVTPANKPAKADLTTVRDWIREMFGR